MTVAAQTVERKSVPSVFRTLLRDQPLLPLSVLLVALVFVVWGFSESTRNLGWVAVILRASVPVAILAGCQTLTMLTGGIDLSVGYVASMAGFVTATFVNQPGGWVLGMVVAIAAAG